MDTLTLRERLIQHILFMKTQADYLAHIRMMARTQPHIAKEALARVTASLNWLVWPTWDEFRQAAMRGVV